MSPTPGSIRIKPLDDASEARWEAFVGQAPGATFFHRAGWRRVVERAFGHRTYYAYAERDGRIVGVLPLTHIASRLFSNGLISNAFGVYGGPVADADEVHAALDAYAEEVMDRVGADFIEYRGRQALRPDWTRKSDLYVTFRREIDPDPDVNLKAIPRKQRAVVRKALKAGTLSAEIDDDVARLYRVYATSVRNLGTPVFARRYFQLLKQEFGDDCEILTLSAGGEPVASVMSFYFRDEVNPYYGGGTAAARRLGANDLMYWRVTERARERGLRLFDFGRSKHGTGSYAFKKNWGFEPEPLAYEFKLRNGKALPDVNPLNPKYRLFIAAWRKLPLPVANSVGPWLARDLG